MEYNHINGFFDKFKKIIYQKQETKKIIRDIVSKNISFNINDDFFDYKNGIIYLKCSPVFKNEIIIRKEKILKDLVQELDPSFRVLDII
jgi:hypothetical protein